MTINIKHGENFLGVTQKSFPNNLEVKINDNICETLINGQNVWTILNEHLEYYELYNEATDYIEELELRIKQLEGDK